MWTSRFERATTSGTGGRGAQASRLSQPRVLARPHLLAPAGGNESAPCGASTIHHHNHMVSMELHRFTKDLKHMNAQNHTSQHRHLPCYIPFTGLTASTTDCSTHMGGSHSLHPSGLLLLHERDGIIMPSRRLRVSTPHPTPTHTGNRHIRARESGRKPKTSHLTRVWGTIEILIVLLTNNYVLSYNNNKRILLNTLPKET